MKTALFTFFLLLWLGVIQHGIAQQTYISHSHEIGTKNGLQGNNIQAVFEDEKGLIWIGTDQGLNRYDGVDIETYTKEKNGIAANYIRSIVEDTHGNIWLKCTLQYGAPPQLSIFNPKTYIAQSLEDYVADLTSLDIADLDFLIQNKDGTIWLIGNNGQIYEYDGTQITHLITIDLKSKNLVDPLNWTKLENNQLSFFAEKAGNIQLYIYDYAQQKMLVHYEHSNPEIKARRKRTPSNDFYWIEWGRSKEKSEVVFYTQQGKDSAKVLKRIQKNGLTQADQDHEYYIVQNNDVLEYYDEKGILIKTIPVLHNFQVSNTLLVDRQGGFWYHDFKTKSLRYLRYELSSFRTYNLDPSNDGTFYRGGRGMALVQGQTLYMGSVFPFEDRIIEDTIQLKSLEGRIREVIDNKQGQVYYAQGDIVSVYDYETNQNATATYQTAVEIDDNLSWSICIDQSGKTWVGNNRGLHYLDHNTKQIISALGPDHSKTPLATSSLHYIHDQGHQLWLATTTGLYLWDKTTGLKAHYHSKADSPNYLPQDILLHIHEDEKGVLWLASKGGGLIEFNPKTKDYTQYSTQNGLAHNVIYCVYEDDYQNLWMSSDRGIIQFNKKEHWVKNYTQENGLLDNEFNTNSHYKDSNGQLYFGSQKGLVIFHPKDFQKKTKTFPILITDLSIQDRDTEEYYDAMSQLQATSTIKINPSDKEFRIKVALPDFRNPKTHQYAYKIEGIDSKWNYQSSNIIADKNLSYGHYQLRIKIKGLDGNEVELDQPIKLIVVRPFYLQWWFIVTLFLASILLIFALIKWRTTQLLVRQKELEQIVENRTKKITQQANDLKKLDQAKSKFFANITHELRTPLTLILGPTSVLLKQEEKPAKQQQLQVIKENGQRLLDLIE
ncbi:MAG: hypothetical protein GY810_13945, partial [Aureispira sp.]|nr:hypothetical protein [Aureispira sp.]